MDSLSSSMMHKQATYSPARNKIMVFGMVLGGMAGRHMNIIRGMNRGVRRTSRFFQPLLDAEAVDVF
jgi:hypothetical protein